MRLLIPVMMPVMMFAVASPALGAEQFDLACKGTKWTQRTGEGAPYDFRLRVDLDANQWCEDDCKTAAQIVSADGDKLVLLSDGTLNTRMEATREATFDRKDMIYVRNDLQSRPTESYLGIWAQCTTEPFTPLPK